MTSNADALSREETRAFKDKLNMEWIADTQEFFNSEKDTTDYEYIRQQFLDNQKYGGVKDYDRKAFLEDVEYGNAFFQKVFDSDKYSYECLTRAALNHINYAACAKWIFLNSTDKELYRVFLYQPGAFTIRAIALHSPHLMLLAENPNFWDTEVKNVKGIALCNLFSQIEDIKYENTTFQEKLPLGTHTKVLNQLISKGHFNETLANFILHSIKGSNSITIKHIISEWYRDKYTLPTSVPDEWVLRALKGDIE